MEWKETMWNIKLYVWSWGKQREIQYSCVITPYNFQHMDQEFQTFGPNSKEKWALISQSIVFGDIN